MKKYYKHAKRSRIDSYCASENNAIYVGDEIPEDSHREVIGAAGTENQTPQPPTNSGPEHNLHNAYEADVEQVQADMPSLDTSDKEQDVTMSECFAEWGVKHGITHLALNEMLKYLRKAHFPEQLKDVRTLLKTCRNVDTISVPPGIYYYFGLEQCIRNLYLKHSLWFKNVGVFDLNINVNGLSLSKSTSSQAYPILCKVRAGNDNGNLSGQGETSKCE